MDVPTFNISTIAVGARGQTVSTFAKVSGYAIGHDVEIISWLPPTYLVSPDEVVAPDGESFVSRDSLLDWQRDLEQQDREGVNHGDAADDLPEPWNTLEDLFYSEKQKVLDQWQRLCNERRAAIERAPFAYTPKGIVFANWTGDHAQWKQAWQAALAVARSALALDLPVKSVNAIIINALYGGHSEHKRLATMSHELTMLTNKRQLVPETFQLTSILMERVFKNNPEARLNPYYVLTNIENEDLSRMVMQHLTERLLKPWLRALEQAPDSEGEPWISLPSKHKLLELVAQGRFFLFEFLADLHTRGTPPGTIAYVSETLTSERHRTGARPLGIGLALRMWSKHDSPFYAIKTLYHTLLHELGHVLDSGDPARELGEDDEFQHQPGLHDRSWRRAFQYNINLAFRAGLLANEDSSEHGENWTMEAFDEHFEAYIDAHRVTDYSGLSANLLRRELTGEGAPRQGMKRALEPDVQTHTAGRAEIYLS